MPTYRVTFEDGRIGRSHDRSPALVRADDYGDLAEAVYEIASPYLASTGVEVVIDLDEDDEESPPTGLVFSGVRTAARFKIEELA